ncbi:MAG TPA: peptide ABC transporter substrate-binding protein [Thermomicrobiales bacterium]|nr:peptide ABC transporter substrate-binding protein [Thermomicrobiales bacterium]
MNARPRIMRLRFLAVATLLLVAMPLLAGAQSFPSAGGGQDGVLRLAGPVDLQTLDPAKAKDLGTLFLVRQIFSGLTRLDDELQPVPALAETIDVSDDGLTYTFTLRRDARFQDGSDITADDVAASLTRALDPATTGGDASLLAAPTFLSDIAGAKELLAGEATNLSGVKVIDDLTLEIQLTQPRSTFLMRLATGPASVIDPNDIDKGDEWWADPNASGPFAIDDFDIDSSMTLEPNGDYFAGKPALDQVRILLGADALQPTNLYQTGAIDVAGVSFFSLDRALDPASDLYADLQQSDLFAVEYLAMRSDVEPLNDPNIRKALILGFPREMVANVSFDGRAAPALGFIPNGMLGQATWPVDGWDYDLDAARQAIANSSYGSAENVPPITIYANGPPDRLISFKEVIERDLGLQIDLVNVEWTEFIATLPKQTYPAYGIYWGADFPDPESLLLTLFGTGQADNYVGYSNPEFDALLQQAAAEQDPEVRDQLYTQANQLLMDDAVVLPFYYDRSYMLVRPWVHGLKLTPLGILSLDQITVET